MGAALSCTGVGGGGGREALMESIRARDGEEVAALLRARPALARRSLFYGMGFTPLHFACAAGPRVAAAGRGGTADGGAGGDEGSAAAVAALLAAGARPNARDARSRTPLMLAARAGDSAAVRLLLATGRAGARYLDSCARSALHYAAAAGRAEVVATLLDPEVLRASGNDDLVPPRLVADTRGFSPWIDARSEGGVTPLHLAALGGHIEALWVLLASGAEPQCTTYGDLAILFSPDPSTGDFLMLSGSTPAHYAVMGASDVRAAQCLRLLASAGASLTQPNDDGRTPLWVARRRGMHVVHAVLQEEARHQLDSPPESMRGREGEEGDAGVPRSAGGGGQLEGGIDILENAALRRLYLSSLGSASTVESNAVACRGRLARKLLKNLSDVLSSAREAQQPPATAAATKGRGEAGDRDGDRRRGAGDDSAEQDKPGGRGKDLEQQDATGVVAQSIGPTEDDALCAICMDRTGNIEISPCGHTLCDVCASRLVRRSVHHTSCAPPSLACPFCRGDLEKFELAPLTPGLHTSTEAEFCGAIMTGERGSQERARTSPVH